MALPYIHFPSRPKAKSRCQWLLLEYSSCLILWSGAKTAVTILLYLRQVKWNSKGHTSWTETSWQCYPTSKVSAKQLHLHFIQFSSANRSLSWRMFLIIVFFFVLMYHLRGRCSKGKGRGIWARGPARGRREERNSFLLPPPSFLACPLRFSLAPNPLSLSFRTPATKAIQNYTEPGSIKAMITSGQPLSVKQSLHWLVPSRFSCSVLNNRDFKIQRRGRQQERQKNNGCN